ncbi:MAG: AraC family transcriptional regulator [Erysipelotrichia bacterium]|nr:AraC family transcriptional regulator [Erysipelotrichia bacterium]
MDVEIIIKPKFYVLGKEGSTEEGKDIVRSLWKDVDNHFDELEEFAVKTEGKPAGFWGIMSDLSRSYKPWEENFTKGLYLAGVECREDAEKQGWVKWTVPGAEYICIRCEDSYPFQAGLDYLKHHGLVMVGAAYDFTDPNTSSSYIYYPVRKLAGSESN